MHVPTLKNYINKQMTFKNLGFLNPNITVQNLQLPFMTKRCNDHDDDYDGQEEENIYFKNLYHFTIIALFCENSTF